jgi:AcrR family transcriptional regulator
MARASSLEPLTPERRRNLTREHLLQAAAQVFAERGFHGTTLDEVASVAGFSKGAVYSNFRNKEDLFLALLAWVYSEEMQALRNTVEGLEGTEAPSESRLSDFVDLLRRQGLGSTNNWGLLYEEFHLYAMRNPTARAKLAELDRKNLEDVALIIETERERQGFKPIESPAQAARIVIALIRGVGMMLALDPDVANDEFLDTVMAFIARGLLTAPEA